MEHYEIPDRILTVNIAHLTPEEFAELEKLNTTARYTYGAVWDRAVDGNTSFAHRFNDRVEGARFIRFDRDGDILTHLDSFMEAY